MGFSFKVIDRVARDSGGSDRSDRTGDGKAGQLGKAIEGASQSSMNEVLDAWGPPPRKQEAPATALAEKPETQAEKNLLKGHIQQNERVEDPLNTDQIGMMALHGHPLAQAGAEMLKTPEAQNKEIRDGIKRDISSMLGDWFKEQFQNVTNVISGFDRWVQANLNAGKLKKAAESIRRAAFGQNDSTAATASKPDGNMANFHLKGVESPQDVAEYGASTTVGAAKALDTVARGLTPRGFAESTHAIAEAGRQAVKNAGEYYGEHGVTDLPAHTADAAKTAYDRLGQWSADRMQMEPGERGDVTGSAMAIMFLVASSKELLNPKEAARRLKVTEAELAEMTDEELARRGLTKTKHPEHLEDEKAVKSGKQEKPHEVTNEALENPEGLAKLAKKFGINMPPNNTYVFAGEKDAVSAEAAAKRLGITKAQLEGLDETALIAQNLECVPDYRDAFFNAHPGLIPIADRLVIHHGLPKWILKEHPGLFTAKELNEEQYLRGITRTENDFVHNKLIHNEWNEFRLDFPNPRREQVLQKFHSIDKKYNKHFVPPAGEKTP